MNKKRNIRKGRNPRYTEALNLAEKNNEIQKQNTEHLYYNYSRSGLVLRSVKKIEENLTGRNEKLTDAYLLLSNKYWTQLTTLESREARLDLLEKALRDYVPDHWLFKEDEPEPMAEEDNVSEETEEEQLSFDFNSSGGPKPN